MKVLPIMQVLSMRCLAAGNPSAVVVADVIARGEGVPEISTISVMHSRRFSNEAANRTTPPLRATLATKTRGCVPSV
jgi:hypothetical protein